MAAYVKSGLVSGNEELTGCASTAHRLHTMGLITPSWEQLAAGPRPDHGTGGGGGGGGGREGTRRTTPWVAESGSRRGAHPS